MADGRAGFTKDGSIILQIIMVGLIAGKAKRKNRAIYNGFVTFQNAFESVRRKLMWSTREPFGLGGRLVWSLQGIQGSSENWQ